MFHLCSHEGMGRFETQAALLRRAIDRLSPAEVDELVLSTPILETAIEREVADELRAADLQPALL